MGMSCCPMLFFLLWYGEFNAPYFYTDIPMPLPVINQGLFFRFDFIQFERFCFKKN